MMDVIRLLGRTEMKNPSKFLDQSDKIWPGPRGPEAEVLLRVLTPLLKLYTAKQVNFFSPEINFFSEIIFFFPK